LAKQALKAASPFSAHPTKNVGRSLFHTKHPLVHYFFNSHLPVGFVALLLVPTAPAVGKQNTE